jgi:hypothetical protein
MASKVDDFGGVAVASNFIVQVDTADPGYDGFVRRRHPKQQSMRHGGSRCARLLALCGPNRPLTPQ